MNPNQPKSEQPSLSLPQPSIEAPEQKNQPARPELDYQMPKIASSQPQAIVVAPASAATVSGTNPITASIQPVAPVPNPALTNVPHAAGDIDLMEKEWMIQAKHLLSRNRNNPYEQAREITSLRTAYLKKRFNKDIKVTDG